MLLESPGVLQQPGASAALQCDSVDSIGVHAPPSWKVVQHHQKHLVEVALLGCWGLHSEQGESGIVVLAEAVGAIVRCVVLVMKQTPCHIS